MAKLKEKMIIPSRFYACVDHYLNGTVGLYYASKKLPDSSIVCGGEYETEEDAVAAAKTLRDLLRKGQQARENAEYWDNQVLLHPDMFERAKT